MSTDDPRITRIRPQAFYVCEPTKPEPLIWPHEDDFPVLREMDPLEPIDEWTPIRFYPEMDDFGHWPRLGMGKHCFSEYARGVVEANLDVKDRFQWLPVVFQTPSRGDVEYFLLHPSAPMDIYHHKAKFNSVGWPTLAILDVHKLEGRALVLYPQAVTLVMRGSLMVALIEAGISQFYFESALVRD